MFGMAKTLIVVYKDEMVVNQLKKLVETHDDNANGDIVGTRDDSVNIVTWNEKIWLNNKKAGNINDKVLFIGNIKGTDTLIPVLDIKFDQYGVKYGWAGNQAMLFTDTKVLRDRNEYMGFIAQISELQVPEIIKEPVNTKISVSKNDEMVKKLEIDKIEKKEMKFFNKAKSSVLKGADVIGKASVNVASKTEDLLRDKNKVTRQMLFYGVINLYKNDLNNFMNV